jgi:hypothetical protein
MCLESWQSSQGSQRTGDVVHISQSQRQKKLLASSSSVFHSGASNFSPVNVNVTHCFPFQAGQALGS